MDRPGQACALQTRPDGGRGPGERVGIPTAHGPGCSPLRDPGEALQSFHRPRMVLDGERSFCLNRLSVGSF